MSRDQLHQIGLVLASHVDMAKGFMGDQFAVSIVARHKQGPFHLLLGDDTELTLIGCLSELQRMGRGLIVDGVQQAEPEPSPADHMVNLLQECAGLFRTYEAHHRREAERLEGGDESTATFQRGRLEKAERNREIAARIEQVLATVAPERKPRPEDTAICDGCDGSGFGVADTYCGKCGGAGGIPMSAATPQSENGQLTEVVPPPFPPPEDTP